MDSVCPTVTLWFAGWVAITGTSIFDDDDGVVAPVQPDRASENPSRNAAPESRCLHFVSIEYPQLLISQIQ